MSKPLPQLPSLDLMRSFVSVGRRMSITLAAEDLFISQSAVSKQIRNLEEAVGTPLLIRGHRSIRLTPVGERLFQTADSALRQMEDVLELITGPQQRSTVTITSSIGITALWLLPRLGSFQQQCPDVDVRVAADNRVHSINTPDMDLAIRYCADADAPPGSTRLFGETLVPVAHPSIVRKLKNMLDSPDALADQVLLELDLPNRAWLHWHYWCADRGWALPTTQRMLRYNQYDQVIHAAMAGQGIAIGRRELITPMLADGRLAALPGVEVQTSPYAYWLVRFGVGRMGVAPGAEVREGLAMFEGWILGEAKAKNETSTS